jgi:hypothetical protein
MNMRARHAVEERHPVIVMCAKHAFFFRWIPTFVGMTAENYLGNIS